MAKSKLKPRRRIKAKPRNRTVLSPRDNRTVRLNFVISQREADLLREVVKNRRLSSFIRNLIILKAQQRRAVGINVAQILRSQVAL